MSDSAQPSTLLRSPFFWAAVGAAIAIPAYRLIMGPASPALPALPVLSQVPDVALIDQDGRPFTTGSLRRGPWIANFFFTSCPTVCPPMMHGLSQLQARLAEEDLPVRIVSISIDPDTDKPAVLKAYGARLGADFERWHFLTGEPETIVSLARKGFLSHVASGRSESVEEPPSAAAHPAHLAHAARLMLVDATGAVRGSFESTPQGSEEILRRARTLVRAR